MLCKYSDIKYSDIKCQMSSVGMADKTFKHYNYNTPPFIERTDLFSGIVVSALLFL